MANTQIKVNNDNERVHFIAYTEKWLLHKQEESWAEKLGYTHLSQ